jgi:tRNA G18 (ribose-2'-O)-methylase SpoU
VRSGPAASGDPLLDDYTHVGHPSWLRDRDLFVAEGRLVVSRAIAARRFRFRSVLVTPAAAAALGDETLVLAGAPVLVCDPARMQEVTGYNFHRGCLALVERPAPADVETLAGTGSPAMLVGLDGVGNPDNTGGIFRSAAAFGAVGVLVGPGSADPLYRKALRTSMGAALDVPWAPVGAWPQALAIVRRAGFVVAALTPSPDAMPLDALANAGRRVLLLFGSEGFGLGEDVLTRADLRVRIPITPRVDSLNVSVAAGIVLHALSGVFTRVDGPPRQEYPAGRAGSQ